MTLRWMVAGVAAFGLAVLTLPAELTHTHAHTAETAGAVEGTMAPACDVDARPADFDFTLQDMNGDDVSFSELKGKVVLLNFWATWCGPCKIEMPWFVEFADHYEDQGLVVLGVSIDDTPDKIQEFAAEYDVDYPMLVGLERDDFMESYGPIWGVPMTFFIDRDGALCRTHAGIAAREEFEKDITDLL
jgi:thiol-disulfide isomerase/thioredoxin